MTERELVALYIKFFESKDHKRIPGASIIPENDSTILFTPAGNSVLFSSVSIITTPSVSADSWFGETEQG